MHLLLVCNADGFLTIRESISIFRLFHVMNHNFNYDLSQSLHMSQVAHQAGAYPSFSGMK